MRGSNGGDVHWSSSPPPTTSTWPAMTARRPLSPSPSRPATTGCTSRGTSTPGKSGSAASSAAGTSTRSTSRPAVVILSAISVCTSPSEPVRLGCATIAARSAAMRSRSTAPTAASSAGVRFFIPAGSGG